jgi:CubicO group peptidase (beta-lactamase class C family)
LSAFGENGEHAAGIQGYLDNLAAQNRFSGAILVAKDGVPIARKVHGVADRTTGAPIELDTKFNLGSMNKMFTAVAIAQLAEQGRLAFGDKVGKHLPAYPNEEVAQKVTIHHLLTHTSGLGSYWGEEFAAKRASLLTVGDHLPLFASKPLDFAPGEKFQYSNSGFMLLGAIIEKVSGRSYHAYVSEKIFQPAGMMGTGFYDPKKEIPNLAIGYTRMTHGGAPGEEERDNNEIREAKGGPAGGGFSTVGDLLKFHLALRHHKLLGAEHLKIVTTGKVEAGGPMGKYAYGFSDKMSGGKRIIGHNGGFPGIAANFEMYPETGYTCVILMNGDRMMMPVVMKLRELLPAG